MFLRIQICKRVSRLLKREHLVDERLGSRWVRFDEAQEVFESKVAVVSRPQSIACQKDRLTGPQIR